MAQALYRKYRPKKLSDVLGHDLNTEILKNAAKTGKLGQAYLFYGSRGTGKTSTARLIAKLLNCEKRAVDPEFAKLGEPCDECTSCKEISENNSLDVIEIDAASNRGIDEIRNLKESITTAPVSGRHKVYIIDEAHMLTGPAFNALLKTLEEPPKHAAIILATTEFEKLPATITSRTQRFLFKKLPKIKILEKLDSIIKEEKIKIGKDALELVASASEGSLRDAESLLEQLSSFGKDITLSDAESLLGRTGFKKIEHLAELIIKNDLKNSLQTLAEISEEGANLVQFTKDLIHYLGKVLTLHLNPGLESAYRSELTDEEIKRLKSLSSSAKEKELSKFIRDLIRSYSEMRYSPFALIPLQITLTENLK
jgi:DNA polymerase-3 subunit gamma/tau